MTMKDYHINIFYSEEDGGSIADIPDLPHCAAFGGSPEEALGEVLRAKAVWMEAAKQAAEKRSTGVMLRVCDFFDFWAVFGSLSLLFSIQTRARI